MKFKKLLAALAVTAGLCLPATVWATCSNYTTYSSGQTLTAASLNSLQTNYTNCVNAVLDGDTWTGNILMHSGTDVLLYSDTGSTLKVALYGDSGKIIGYPVSRGTSNIDLVVATTTNANDTIKVQCGGATCSATNPGFLVLPSTTAGALTGFVITADVSILLTGAHWLPSAGSGTADDLTGAILRVLAANDNGTLRICVAALGGRDTLLTTDTNATQGSITLPEHVLCNTAVGSATNTVMEIGHFRANYDDTGGAAEKLWAIQSGVNDIVTGGTADGLWQPWNPTYTGFSANPTSPTARWTMNDRIVTLYYSATAGTSNATTFTITNGPVKAAYGTGSGITRGINSSSNIATVDGFIAAGATTITCSIAANSNGWTGSGTKAIYFYNYSYEAGPTASFIE